MCTLMHYQLDLDRHLDIEAAFKGIETSTMFDSDFPRATWECIV